MSTPPPPGGVSIFGYCTSVTRVALLVLAVAACSSTEELEAKVTKLEHDIATLRKERQFLELKQVQLLKEVGEVRGKLDELTKKPPPPTTWTRPARQKPDPQTTYSLAIDPLDPVDGAPDALVTIVEAYEYACPFCERARTTIEELKKRYGKDLRWVGKPLVVHPQVATAPALAICAASKQRRFDPMDHQLWEDGFKARRFDKLGCWDEIGGCPIVGGFARKAGIDMKMFRDDMKDACREWLRNSEAAIKRVGASGTPSFFINGRFLSGARPVDDFARLIDEELAKAQARVQAGTARADYYQKWVVEDGVPDIGP